MFCLCWAFWTREKHFQHQAKLSTATCFLLKGQISHVSNAAFLDSQEETTATHPFLLLDRTCYTHTLQHQCSILQLGLQHEPSMGSRESERNVGFQNPSPSSPDLQRLSEIWEFVRRTWDLQRIRFLVVQLITNPDICWSWSVATSIKNVPAGLLTNALMTLTSCILLVSQVTLYNK